MEGWNEVSLGDFIALQRGHDLPEKTRIKGAIPVIGSSGLTGFHNVAKTKGPGVTIGRSGNSIGVATYVGEDFWPLNTVMYVTDFKGNNEKFVYYILQNIDFTSHNSGSAQPSLNRNYIYPIRIQVPDRLIQNRIVEIISSLDDKIELNRCMNETLEQMAMTLYKHWFVDFGPFQNEEFEESELGIIPKGWNVVALSEILTMVHGFAFKSNQMTDDKNSNRIVRMGNFKETGGLQFQDNTKYLLVETTTEKHQKYTLKSNDLVMVLSDVTRDGRIIGKVGFVPNDEYVYWLNQRVAKIDTKEEWKYFLYILFNSEEFRNHCLVNANSTTVLNLKNEHVYNFKVAVPNNDLLQDFNGILANYFHQIDVLTKESLHLSNIKDYLLPRLLSGDIKTAEEQIEEVLSHG